VAVNEGGGRRNVATKYAGVMAVLSKQRASDAGQRKVRMGSILTHIRTSRSDKFCSFSPVWYCFFSHSKLSPLFSASIFRRWSSSHLPIASHLQDYLLLFLLLSQSTRLSTMKLTTSAVLLALSGAVYAVPLPMGVLDNVQDNCTGMGSGCVPAGPFLHHLADSETKYLHLIHPETGAVTHVIAPSSSLTASTSSTAGAATTNDDEIASTKPAAGVYPSSNHPATSTPFTEPPSISSSNGTSVGSSSIKPVSLTAVDGTIKPQDDDQQLDRPSPVRPAGTAVAPNSTLADQLATGAESSTAAAPVAAPALNQTSPEAPAPSSSPAPAVDDTKKLADVNSTNIADATGVAQAPKLVHSNDVNPDQKVRVVNISS
jgi:hypothetical protein